MGALREGGAPPSSVPVVRRASEVPPDVRTVHLGAYVPEHAPLVCDALEQAGIVWWAKVPGGWLTRLWDREVQIFVDRTRLDEARELASRALGT